MQRSKKNRSPKVTTQNRLKKQPQKPESNNKNSNILDFIKSFKPLNESTNLLNQPSTKCKRRNTNYSYKIINNMKEKFDSLPPGYLKKRRMEKLNSRGIEQRQRYRNLLDIFREDTENCPPTPLDINNYTTELSYSQTTNTNNSYHSPQANLPHPPAVPEILGDSIDRILEEELYYQGAHISRTMDELYSIATMPSGEANKWNFYTNQWSTDEAYQYTNTAHAWPVNYSYAPSLIYSDTSVCTAYDTVLVL